MMEQVCVTSVFDWCVCFFLDEYMAIKVHVHMQNLPLPTAAYYVYKLGYYYY